MPTTQAMIELMWTTLRAEIAQVRRDVDRIERNSQRAETAGGFKGYRFEDLPNPAAGGYADAIDYVDVIWVNNGLKIGETAGAGTGVLCYWNAATAQWLRVSDDLAVTS